jgi:hypothetical protein
VSLLAEVERLLRTGREQVGRGRVVGEAADRVRRAYGSRLDALERELTRAFERGARAGKADAGLNRLGREVTDLDGGPHARQRTLDLLTDMATEQRRVLVMVDRHARRLGLVPARRLDLLRAAGGLNRRQAETLLRRHELMLERGLPARQRRRALVAEGDRMRRQRARMIARTEAQVAENVGREAAWMVGRDLGLISRAARRVWVTALDERTCPTCSALDGVSIPLDGAWDASGVAVATPGAVHPHCRCSERLEDGPAARRAA